MTNHVSLAAGILTGFAIAAPIGPMGLLCIQRTLAAGMAIGVCTGLGAVTVNVTYSAIVLFGLNSLTPWMVDGGRLLNALGGLFLLWSAFKALRAGGPDRVVSAPVVPSRLVAYGSAVALNASNPMALVLIVALLSRFVGGSAPAPAEAAMFLAGMFTAAMTWWICLSASVALLRARVTPTVLTFVNQVAGALLTLYGALALARSAQM
jgi:threonine/homoserine/homoserine lactone efflux protein